jgi:hypothetical protein
MSEFESKRGPTIRDVRFGCKMGMTAQQISALTGRSISAVRCCQYRLNVKLKSEFGRKEWGSLKKKIISIDTHNYTAQELSEMLGTSRYAIYSLCTRHNKKLKKKDYTYKKNIV